MDLPGPGTVFMSQTLSYKAPTYLGDTLTAEIEVKPTAGRELADALARAVDLGRNMVRLLDARAGAADGELFSTERACPKCSRSFEPLDPRLFSYNSRYGWCPECFGTGVDLSGFDDEQTGQDTLVLYTLSRRE